MMQLSASCTRSYSELEVKLFIQNRQLKELFNLGIDPNYVFVKSGNSMLHLSVKHGSTSLTYSLIRMGCDVNIQNRLGNTALMDAVMQKNLSQVRLLLKAKSDIQVTNVEGDTALKLSLKSLDDPTELVIMKCLFSQMRSTIANSEVIFKMLTEANCSLTCAVFSNDVKALKLMLHKDFDVNNRDFYNGWTALHVAVMETNAGMVKLLIDHGCDANIPDVFGSLPLNYVFEYGMAQCPEIINALMPTKVNWTELCYPGGAMKLHSVFARGSKETLQLFLRSNKINFSKKDKCGNTPLHYLACNTKDGIFDLYQNVDFDVNAYADKVKKTALHIATIQGNVEGVKFLLARGADVNATDHFGYTPIFYAVSRCNSRENAYKECAELLAHHGANLQVVTPEGDSLFRKASRCQNYVLIEPLLAHLAIIEAAGELIKALILDHIDSDSHLKRHYELCKQDLTRMKMKTMFGTVTLWTFLIDNDNKIALYTKRQQLLNEIMDANFVSNSYYISLLRKRFNKAVEISNLRTKASQVLNEAIPQLGGNHIIVNQITRFLSYTELLKFS